MCAPPISLRHLHHSRMDYSHSISALPAHRLLPALLTIAFMAGIIPVFHDWDYIGFACRSAEILAIAWLIMKRRRHYKSGRLSYSLLTISIVSMPYSCLHLHCADTSFHDGTWWMTSTELVFLPAVSTPFHSVFARNHRYGQSYLSSRPLAMLFCGIRNASSARRFLTLPNYYFSPSRRRYKYRSLRPGSVESASLAAATAMKYYSIFIFDVASGLLADDTARPVSLS